MTDSSPGAPDDPPRGSAADADANAAADAAADDDTVEPAASGAVQHGSEEEIDEAGDESFPASDAPQWWSGEPGDDA